MIKIKEISILMKQFTKDGFEEEVLSLKGLNPLYVMQQDEWEREPFFDISAIVLASPAVESCCRT